MFGRSVARVVVRKTKVLEISATPAMNPMQDFLVCDYILLELFLSKIIKIGMRKSVVTERIAATYPLLQQMYALLLSQLFHTPANHKPRSRHPGPVQRVQNGGGNRPGTSRIILINHGKIIKGESNRTCLG